MFSILKWFGTAYLIYLGVNNLRPSKNIQPSQKRTNESLQKIFCRGVIIELLNPKTILFFLAFLPQFVDSAKGGVTTQILTLGFIFVGLAMIIDILYAVLAASTGRILRGKRRFMRGHRYAESSVYIGLGAAIALSGS